MRGFRSRAAAIIGAATLLAANEVQACSPIPPPPRLDGETTEAYADRRHREIQAEQAIAQTRRIAHEVDLLATSDQIVLARVAHLVPTRERSGRMMVSFTEIELQAVAVLRGEHPAVQFRRRHREHIPGMCDFEGQPESLDRIDEGDLILIFANSGELGPSTFREAARKESAMSPAMQALFNDHALTQSPS